MFHQLLTGLEITATELKLLQNSESSATSKRNLFHNKNKTKTETVFLIKNMDILTQE